MVSAKLKRHLQNGASSSTEQEIIEPKASEQLTKQLWNFLTQSNNILTENIESFLEEQNDTNAKWSVVTEVSSLPNSILLTNDDNTMTLHNLPKRRHHFNSNNNNNVKLLRNRILDNSNNNSSSGTQWLTEISTPVSNMTSSLSSASASASASLGTQLLLTEATKQSTATVKSVTSTTAAVASASTLATENAAFSIFPATNASLILNDINASALWNFNTTGEDDFDFFYRHSFWMSTLLIFAYIVVFVVGLVGNSFVIAVVLRAPRMRTVTNYFIVNLAVADILVIIFCLPATLMSNIFLLSYAYSFKDAWLGFLKCT